MLNVLRKLLYRADLSLLEAFVFIGQRRRSSAKRLLLRARSKVPCPARVDTWTRLHRLKQRTPECVFVTSPREKRF